MLLFSNPAGITLREISYTLYIKYKHTHTHSCLYNILYRRQRIIGLEIILSK